ncbi:hypothetical protein [Umezawaea sp. Da 62-37]|uniref:hypothetical protein n=1 Tax=Umezawaea sp. Da 62-37 TaxID=3075927 RepID=UPI0028F7170E|nr:hypothetical protein [Umezawaea sp. Da 62-37]WNV90638.1 hypothetical protein RM788_20845 [Umezawaea sp. Da 62-37]
MTTVTRPKVTFADVLRVAWRRHRTLILATAALTAALTASVLWSAETMEAGPGNLAGVYFRLFWQPQEINLLLGAAIAVFWGAPLVAREHEARTNLVAWGQDVPATRWLTGQVALLGFFAACFATVLGLSEQHLTSRIREITGGRLNQPFTAWFEVAPQLQIGYALFGFALGVAVSALVRRTLPAMGIALVVFGVVRVAIIERGRARFLPPVHTFEPWNDNYQHQVPDYAMYVGSGYGDVNGVPVTYQQSWGCGGLTSGENLDCLKANGVAGHYADFQPVERLDLFRWIETGIFLVLTAALLALAWYWLKRARRV